MNRLAFLSVLSACLTLDAWAAVQVSDVVWRQEADTRQVVCTYALDTAAMKKLPVSKIKNPQSDQ